MGANLMLAHLAPQEALPAYHAGWNDACGGQGSYANLFQDPAQRAAYEQGYHGAKKLSVKPAPWQWAEAA